MTPYEASILAGRVYSDPPTIGAADSSSRLKIYETPEGVVHALRGTDNIMSAIADGNIDQAEVWGMGKLHEGFWDSMASILPAARAAGTPSVIVGHSLGAAMAIIYAGVLALQGVVVPVFAFEPPKVAGDDVLRDLLTSKRVPVYATRNGNDLVTQLPPGFQHAVDLVDIGKAEHVWPNIEDHEIAAVQAALKEA